MKQSALNKIMLEHLNQVKNLREQLFVQDKLIPINKQEELKNKVLNLSFNTGFEDISFYNKELNKIRAKMLMSYFQTLILEKKIDNIKIIKNIPILALLHITNKNCELYYFKEYGQLDSANRYLIYQLQLKFNPTTTHLVSLTTGNPNSYIFNESETNNQDMNLETFFNILFNNDEYNVFLSFINKFTKEVNQINSISSIKPLTATTSYFFLKHIKDYLLSDEFKNTIMKYNDIDNLDSISLETINRNFFENERYRSVTRKSTFSDSLITAEWMYESLNIINNIDLTVISLGYFKSLEQFLFEFIKSHSGEDRKIKRMRYKELNKRHLPDKIYLNHTAIENEYINFMLDSLIDFLEDPSNKDIFESTIDDSTINHITNCLECAKKARNGYFHKDNITDWEIVQYSREIVLISIYYFLGSIKIEDKQIDSLNIPTIKLTDYTKICEFIYYNRHYLYKIQTNKEQFLAVANADDKRTIDENNEPIYSGAYVTKYLNVSVDLKELLLEDIPNIQLEKNHLLNLNDPNLTIDICSFEPFEKGFKITSQYKTIYKNMHYYKNI